MYKLVEPRGVTRGVLCGGCIVYHIHCENLLLRSGFGWFSEDVWVCAVLTLEPFAAPIRARGLVLVVFALYALRVRGSPWLRVSGWGWTNQR